MPDTVGGHDELSEGLRQLRTRAGLSQVAAAKLMGWSQPKISRYERGRMVPPPAEVVALAELYGAPPRRQRGLEKLAALLREETRPPARVVMQRPGRMQQRIGEIEASSQMVRAFVPTIVHGLLQTPAYVRELFRVGRAEMTPGEVEAGIEARLARHALLVGSDRRFVLVMTEGALRWQIGGPAVMVEQLRHLAEASRSEHVQVGLIPWTTRAPDVPMHGFDIYDHRAVVVGTRAATAFLTDPRDVELHERMWERLAGAAVFGAELRVELARIADDYRALA